MRALPCLISRSFISHRVCYFLVLLLFCLFVWLWRLVAPWGPIQIAICGTPAVPCSKTRLKTWPFCQLQEVGYSLWYPSLCAHCTLWDFVSPPQKKTLSAFFSFCLAVLSFWLYSVYNPPYLFSLPIPIAFLLLYDLISSLILPPHQQQTICCQVLIKSPWLPSLSFLHHHTQHLLKLQFF